MFNGLRSIMIVNSNSNAISCNSILYLGASLQLASDLGPIVRCPYPAILKNDVIDTAIANLKRLYTSVRGYEQHLDSDNKAIFSRNKSILVGLLYVSLHVVKQIDAISNITSEYRRALKDSVYSACNNIYNNFDKFSIHTIPSSQHMAANKRK